MEPAAFTSVREARAHAQQHIGKLVLIIEFHASFTPQREGRQNVFYDTRASHLGVIAQETNNRLEEEIPADRYVTILPLPVRIRGRKPDLRHRTHIHEGNMPLSINVLDEEVRAYSELEKDWSMHTDLGSDFDFTGIRLFTERPFIDAYFTIGDRFLSLYDVIKEQPEELGQLHSAVRTVGRHSVDFAYGTALRKLGFDVPAMFDRKQWEASIHEWKQTQKDLERHAHQNLKGNRALLKELEASGIGRSYKKMQVGTKRVPIRDYVEALRILTGNIVKD